MWVNAPVLGYFDIERQAESTLLFVDSSSKGMGAALLQEGKPVAYASYALTETQQRYSQIEKETLAIVSGCKSIQNSFMDRK